MSAWTLDRACETYPQMTRDDLYETVAPFLHVYEVICRCGCGEWVVSQGGLYLWSALRFAVGYPICVSSGKRCTAHNLLLEGGMMHPRGEALDLRYPSLISTSSFLQICDNVVRNGGLGVYGWGVHVDTGIDRDPHRRWEEGK